MRIWGSRPASDLIDERIGALGDWRGEVLARVRAIIHAAVPEITEEWKWRGVPTWDRGGIVCTGETYKDKIKLTFAKGAALADPSGLFNASLDGNVWRSIDLFEGGTLEEAALEDLIKRAVELNLPLRSAETGAYRAELQRRPSPSP